MAAYNEEKYIGEAIESVLHQTFSDFEFIIINDGSTDKTEEIIKSFNDSRIKYIKNQQNLKLIASLNKGLKEASGKYIARMDADDICFQERLEKQVAFMDSNPEIGISGTQLEIFGNATGTMVYPLSDEQIKERLFITSCFGNNVVIFRRELLEKHNLFFPEGYFHAEDYKCWTNWIKYTKLANLNESLVKYRSHAGSVSVKNRNTQQETRNRIRKEYLIEQFELSSDKAIAENFTGDLNKERIKASQKIIEINNKKSTLKKQSLEQIILDLWYSDCLEKIENDFFVIFKYRHIYKLSFGTHGKRWWFLFKHYFKVKLSK